jgi:hypothetical protein
VREVKGKQEDTCCQRIRSLFGLRKRVSHKYIDNTYEGIEEGPYGQFKAPRIPESHIKTESSVSLHSEFQRNTGDKRGNSNSGFKSRKIGKSKSNYGTHDTRSTNSNFTENSHFNRNLLQGASSPNTLHSNAIFVRPAPKEAAEMEVNVDSLIPLPISNDVQNHVEDTQIHKYQERGSEKSQNNTRYKGRRALSPNRDNETNNFEIGNAECSELSLTALAPCATALEGIFLGYKI